MTEHRVRPVPGGIALVGSGEYLDVMNETDTYLLGTIGGAHDARVVLLPTASGLEENGPEYWNDLGHRHFQHLGVRDVRAAHIIDKTSAADPAQLALLSDASFFYFSGGNPQHLIETLQGSPAWDIIKLAYERGAVLAGCSAGAMALAGYTISVRQALAGTSPNWSQSLGLLPGLVVFPHFDRIAGFMGQAIFQGILDTIPEGHLAVGIEEDTALVRLESGNTAAASAPARWRVMGRQTVKVFNGSETPRSIHSGEEVLL